MSKYFKIFTIVTVLCLCYCLNSHAQRLNPLSSSLEALRPVNIFPANAESGYDFRDRNKAVQPSSFKAKRNTLSGPVFTAEVTSPAKGHTDVQTTWKSSGFVKRGDILLARFAIRSIYAKQESGEAVVYFFVNQGVAPFERNIIIDLSVGAEWKTVDVPFKAVHDMAASEGIIGFTFGALAQKVEIAGVQVLNFESKTTLAALPLTKFTYPGREEGAAWRREALKRIEQLRTAPINIKVIDAAGKGVTGASVHLNLVQSDFIWGTAANEALLGDELPHSANYRKYLKELFNTAVIENGFKAGVWQGKPERRQQTMRAFNWLETQGFRQRGHNAVWPGWKFNPALFKQIAEMDTAKFRQLIEDDVRSKMTTLKGRVIAWDVINEPVHEKDLQKHLPPDIAVQWFKLAKSIDPEAQLFINEYSMLNSIYSPKNIQEYLDTIASLRKGGAPIEAIGIQGHVGRQPRAPAQVISDLDLFVETGLPVQITEFDINSPDEELQADYTRDFLIACYSHPVISGFNKWGFWEGAHWKPDAAMFRRDWSAKPNAAIWRKWVTGKWKTNATVTTEAKGLATTRGHFGKYEITVTKGGKTVKAIYQLSKESGPATIKL